MGGASVTDSQKLDAILSEIRKLSGWQENLSNHVEKLNIHVGVMNNRLTEVEKAINRIALTVGTTGVPAVGGGLVPAMPIEAKGHKR